MPPDRSEVLLPAILAREMLARQRSTDVVGQSIGFGVFLEGPEPGPLLPARRGQRGLPLLSDGDLDRPVAFAVMTNSEVGDRILGPLITALSAAYSR